MFDVKVKFLSLQQKQFSVLWNFSYTLLFPATSTEYGTFHSHTQRLTLLLGASSSCTSGVIISFEPWFSIDDSTWADGDFCIPIKSSLLPWKVERSSFPTHPSHPRESLVAFVVDFFGSGHSVGRQLEVNKAKTVRESAISKLAFTSGNLRL